MIVDTVWFQELNIKTSKHQIISLNKHISLSLTKGHPRVGQIFQKSLKSRLNSPGWEKMTRLNVQESLFGKLPIHWTNLMSTPDLQANSYILVTVLHTNSYITLGWPWFPTRMFQSVSGQSSEKSRAHYSSRPTVSQL